MKAMRVATIAWRPESLKAILNSRLSPFIPSYESPGTHFCTLPKLPEKNQRHPQLCS